MEQMESFLSIFDEHKLQVAREKGEKQGEKRLTLLLNAMIANNEANMIQTVFNDNMLKETYYKKYNI